MKQILGGAVLAACLALLAGAAVAAGTDELWEVSTQMNIPGMPAGMGGQTRQVCTEKGDPKKAMAREDSKCKVTDLKETGTRIQMTVQCPDGTGTIDNTFNAARTEYKGTMKMTSKQGEMTMAMQGRKVGTCDATAAKAQQSAEMDKYKAQAAVGMAQMEAANKQQIEACKQAPVSMQLDKLGMYSQCSAEPGSCERMAKSPQTAEVAKVCMASAQDYCTKYQTRDGFLKASRWAEHTQKACKVDNAQLKTSFCAQASKSEDLPFLASQCPVEAKPIAQAHCAGRGYTSRVKDKWTDFCTTYLSHAKPEDEAAPPASTATSIVKDPAKATSEAVNQGINKLKGLFGR
jgi:hypothetical protein